MGPGFAASLHQREIWKMPIALQLAIFADDLPLGDVSVAPMS